MALQTITTVDALKQSATRYEKDLLIMPVTVAQATLSHMRGIPGLHGNVVLGALDGNAELAPYKSTRSADGDFKIDARTLELRLGNCAYNFDPNEVWNTIYGSLVVKGEGLKGVDINKSILMLVAGKLGRKLNMAIFSGAYDADGDTTATLFDGFDTITKKEITAGNISAEKGNYVKLAKFTEENAIDQFQALYDAADDELQSQHVKIFCTKDQYAAYNRNYQLLHGALPYNTEFKKTFLEGTDNLWEFCPLASKKGSSYIQVAPQSNMVYGYGAGENPGETLAVEKYSSWKLTLEAAFAFGVQYASLSKEVLLAAEVATA